MKMLSAEEERQIENTITDHKEAVCWAFETAKRIMRAGIPIEVFATHRRGAFGMPRNFEKDNENRYRLKILGKDFNMADKQDRGRISGFLDHFEMNEEARLEKEAEERKRAARKARGDE